MFRNIKSLFLVLIITIGFVQLGFTQVKIGYINTDELLKVLPEMKMANDSMYGEKTRLEDKMKGLVADLTKKAIALEQTKNEKAPVQYQKEVELLKQEEQNIMKMEELGKQQLSLLSENLLKPIQEKVNAAIKMVAEENGYQYVLDEAQGIVLFADKSVNLMDKLKAKLVK